MHTPRMERNRRVLVTGCAGFIGSHVCERLLKNGDTVIGIDNFSPFYPKKIKTNNMSEFITHNNFTFHEIDICDYEKLTTKIENSLDLVVHLAAKAGVRPSITSPSSYIDVNVNGTINILNLIRERKCDKLFFASSSSVYGLENQAPFNENAIVNTPISPYAASKLSAELINYTYHNLYRLNVINARFFTVYGPRQRPDLAINKFTRLILQDEPIEMYGNGSTSRDYTYIDDVVSGIINGIEYLFNNSRVFETINIGNNKPILLKDLIDKLYSLTKKEPQIIIKDTQMGDMTATCADISKANNLINYSPNTDLDKGLTSFIDWIKKNHF